MSKKDKCVLNCDNPVDHPKSGLCSPCYNAVNYWRKKSVTQMMAYMGKLFSRSNRMEALVIRRGATPIKKKAR